MPSYGSYSLQYGLLYGLPHGLAYGFPHGLSYGLPDGFLSCLLYGLPWSPVLSRGLPSGW